MTDILELRNLRAGYGGSAVLHGINLNVGGAEVVAILGRNGMGKTTLLKTIMGLVPGRGEILFEGRDVVNWPSHERARAGLGYVPQGRGLFAEMTVAENIRSGLMVARATRRSGRTFEDELHELFPILRQRSGQLAGTMSGGEQQQVAFARALIGRPSLLVLDEPSEGIQPSIVKRLSEAILKLNRLHRQAVLLVEQNIEMVASVASRCYIVEKGRVIHEAPVNEESLPRLHKLLSI